MIRFFIVALMSIGLVACAEESPSIEGKWAWVDAASCEGDLDTIELSGTSFTRRLRGEVARLGRDLAYRQTDEEGASRVTAIYLWETDAASVTVTITFEPQGTDVLIYRGSTIDGQVPPTAAGNLGRELFRCS